MTDTLTHRPPNLTASPSISQHEVIVRQYELIVELRNALQTISHDCESIGFGMRAKSVAANALAKADSYLK
jgi:hypothetical protein